MYKNGNRVRFDPPEPEKYGVDPDVSVESAMQTADVFAEILPGLEQSVPTLLHSERLKDQNEAIKRQHRIVELRQFVHQVHEICAVEYAKRHQEATR